MEERNFDIKTTDKSGNIVDLMYKVYWTDGKFLNYLCVIAQSEKQAREKLINDLKDKEKWTVDTANYKVLNAELLGEFIK